MKPGGPPNDLLLHINLLDAKNILQQEAVGILGVNIIFAANYQLQTKESFFEGLAQDVVRERAEVDFVELRGPAFSGWDQQTLLAYLVHAGYAEAVWFSAKGEVGPPSELLHKRAVVLAPGYFGHVDDAHGQIHSRMMAAGIQELRDELGATDASPVDPTGDAGGFVPGATTQARAAFVYGGGVDWNLTQHLAIRAEYRGFVYERPDFNLAALHSGAVTNTGQPSAGIVFRF